jgi:hypothetical protein
VQTEAELTTMNKKQRWARAGHADGAEAEANALDLADGSSWAQNGSFSVHCIWILPTDPPAQLRFGYCQRILQSIDAVLL